MRILLNPPLSVKKADHDLSWSAFHCKFKNADMDYVRKNSNESIRNLLDQVPLENHHRYLCVDIKPIVTDPGQCVCLPGWHLDTVENPFNSDELPERHHIICLLSDDTTEYIETPLDLDIDHSDSIKDIRIKIDAVPYSVYKAPRDAFVTYGRLNLHRGPVAVTSGQRVLVRVSETNVIKPNRLSTPI